MVTAPSAMEPLLAEGWISEASESDRVDDRCFKGRGSAGLSRNAIELLMIYRRAERAFLLEIYRKSSEVRPSCLLIDMAQLSGTLMSRSSHLGSLIAASNTA